MISAGRIQFVISLFFVLRNGSSVSMHNPFYCYSEDPIRPQIGMFGTEAPYERIRGQIDPNVSSCTPSKFWLVGRNGQRFPNSNELRMISQHGETLQRDIVNNYNAGRTSLCTADIELIRNWKFDPNITDDGEQHLIVTGWNEVVEIAQRFQLAYPTLLPPIYSPSHYLFQSTNITAMTTALDAFADGLFGHDGHHQVEFEDFHDPDLLLRSMQNCPLLEDITSADIEENAFAEGPEYQTMLTQVSSKLGFHGSRSLSNEEIQTLLTLCRHEQIWDLNAAAPFCAAFSVANHQVLEYRRCLFTYYRYGWGFQSSNFNQFFRNVPCHLVQDMLHFLRSNDPSDQRAKIYNTAGAQMALALHALGAYNDDAVPLTRHNFAQQTFRHYRSSSIYATAHNLAVIRYDCADGDHDVLFLHSERPIQLPGCQPNGLCKLSMLLDRLSEYLDVNCTEIFCTNSRQQK